MIRACIDLTVPNKFMERNRITQGPVVEDFIYKFHDCVIFSKLDLRSGYHQLMLHVVVVALLFYVHGKHLRSCRDGQIT